MGDLDVGVGSRHHRSESERDVAAVGFSPRNAQTVVYLTGVLNDYQDLLARLGGYQTGKGRRYLKRVDDLNLGVLWEIVTRSQRLAARS